MAIYDQIANLGRGFDPFAAYQEGVQMRQRNALFRQQQEDRERENARRNMLAQLTEQAALATDDARPRILAQIAGIDPQKATAMGKIYAGGMDGGSEYGLTPMYGVDETGAVIPFQLSKKGGVKPVELPGGVRAVRPLSFGDIGSELIGRNPLTGAVETRYQKGLTPAQQPAAVEATKAAEARGKAAATAEEEFPQVEADARYMLDLLDGLKSHPGLEMAVGKSSIIPVIPGTAQADFVARLDQIKGQQFLQAYQSLKGGGQITEVEGKKAEQAIARMDRAQSEKEFRKAIDEFSMIVRAWLQRAKKKAGRSVSDLPGYREMPKAEPKAAPTIEDLLKKYGG